MKGSLAVSWGLLLLCALHACATRCTTKKPRAAVHAGFCPAQIGNIGITCTKEITKVFCSDDSNCASDEKCCKEPICTTKCMKAVTEKSGSCPQPPSYPRCEELKVKPANGCSEDQQCPGKKKCCYYGCSLQCTEPLQEKLGSCQDYDRTICDRVRTLPAECASDSQCPGAKRCCCQNCRKACWETVKSGICPPIKAKCEVPLPKPNCTNDSGCPGRQKCCSFCGMKCLEPEPENPGICPVDPEIENQCGSQLATFCSRDRDCAPNEKCCRFGCGVQCVKALTEKAGVCPAILAKCKVPQDPHQCQRDSDCLSNKKCCNQCGNKCSNPELVHDGFCPAPKPVRCAEKYSYKCRRDSECKADQKCCDVGCRTDCVKSAQEKSGSCPFIQQDGLSDGVCNKCNDDKDCPGNAKCCAGTNRRECQDPQPGNVIVKDGECPPLLNWCDRPPPYEHQCNNDGNCSGEQKCCTRLCWRECVDAVPVKPHPGTCPPDNIKCAQPEENQCKTDSTCKENEKCCTKRCGLKCVPAVLAHAGFCPTFPGKSDIVCTNNITKILCNDDSTCASDQKCCKVPVCTTKCEKAVTEKPGVCPIPKIMCRILPLPRKCNNDGDCPGLEKCCTLSCSIGCSNTTRVQEKPGVCPIPKIMCHLLPLPRKCNNDGDCPGLEKCCTLSCSIGCTNATRNPDPGTCPPDSRKCKKRDDDQCTIDSNCKEGEKCCYYKCGLKCVPAVPVKPHPGTCPPDNIMCIRAEDNQCETDSTCKENEKCCTKRCGLKCVPAVPEKAGQCPVPRTICSPEASQEEPGCNQDSDCGGAQKCCIPFCKKECTDPIPEEKAGQCPVPRTICSPEASQEKPGCNQDSDCGGAQKCCIPFCKKECTDPIPEVHSGACPIVNSTVVAFCPIQPDNPVCSSDSQCPADQKCCKTVCGVRCVKSVPVHPGACPFVSKTGVFHCPMIPVNPVCSSDSQCPSDQKCCNTTCGIKCVKSVSVTPKPGTCPKDTIMCIQKEDDQCKIDGDCTGDKKCCYNQCGFKCVDAVKESPKPGTCPPDPIRCSKPADNWCKNDNECQGDYKCCHKECGLKCVAPLPVTEKDGSCPLPPSYPTCKTFTTKPEDQCTDDFQCKDDEKCCVYGCNRQCKKPLQDKLGFCPYFDRSICITAKPSPAECSEDAQCQGTQKCCCHGLCRMECTKTDKPGICPRALEQCKDPLPEPACKDDSGCKGKMKCCYSCGWKCIPPAENPGFCPAELERKVQCDFQKPPQCKSDSDCALNEKCCMFGCGVQCVKALAAAPGMCPAILAKCSLPFPKPECHTDGDCMPNYKCCQLCGNKCLAAVPDHEGVCPSYINEPVPCPANDSPSCNHDWECEEDQKCCKNGCKIECVKALKEKMGLCRPKKVEYTASADHCDKCNTDKDCPGMDKCCGGAKGRECIPPLMFDELRLPSAAPDRKG